MNFQCHYCEERKEIVTFIDDGFVPGVIGVKKSNACCYDCSQAPKGIDGQPSPGAVVEEDYPF